MKVDELYKRCDERLLPILEPLGFVRQQPADYIREDEKGWDRIQIDYGPRGKKNTHFAVMVGYKHRAQKLILDELFNLSPEEEGFSVGPYLNPVSVTSRPKYWGYRTVEALGKSLNHVLECLLNTGLPWLETLRDPKVFAENVDPMALIPAGIAYEAAGSLEKARRTYQQKHDVYCRMLEEFGDKMVMKKSGKAFIFVTGKLGVEAERRNRFEEELDFHPEIFPLSF